MAEHSHTVSSYNRVVLRAEIIGVQVQFLGP